MEMRMIFFLHRIGAFRLTDNPALSSKDVLAIATRNGSLCPVMEMNWAKSRLGGLLI